MLELVRAAPPRPVGDLPCLALRVPPLCSSGPRMMTGSPGIPAHLRRNPRGYVVADDLAALGSGLCNRFGGELAQWRVADELSITAVGIVAVLSAFRGLKGGRDGCGVQAPLEAWAALLGRSRRMIAYAFDELRARGLVFRHRRLVRHKWVDANGITRERADIHAAAYLSKLGAVRIARRGETRRLVLKDGHTARVLCAAGVVGDLLRSQREKLQLISLRVTDAVARCTPSLKTLQKKHSRTVKEHPPGAGRGTTSPAQAPPAPQRPSPLAYGEGGIAQLNDLAKRGVLSPWLVWPELWEASDARQRGWLWAELKRSAAALKLKVIKPGKGRRAAPSPVFLPVLELLPCGICGQPGPFKVWGSPSCAAHVDHSRSSEDQDSSAHPAESQAIR